VFSGDQSLAGVALWNAPLVITAEIGVRLPPLGCCLGLLVGPPARASERGTAVVIHVDGESYFSRHQITISDGEGYGYFIRLLIENDDTVFVCSSEIKF